MSDTFFNPDAPVQRIEFESTNGKQATLIVDGVDISRYVVKVEFYMHAGSRHYPQAYIELLVDVADLKISAPADVTYATPPDEPDQWGKAKIDHIHEQERRQKLRRIDDLKGAPSRP